MLKLSLPFLIIIALEFLISFGLDYYNKILESQILNLENNLQIKEEELLSKLNKNEAFFVFSQTAHIREIFQNRKSSLKMFENIKKLIPKFVTVNSFTYDADKREISFNFEVSNWSDYARFLKYIKSKPELTLKLVFPPQILENKIAFSVVLALKENIYQ